MDDTAESTLSAAIMATSVIAAPNGGTPSRQTEVLRACQTRPIPPDGAGVAPLRAVLETQSLYPKLQELLETNLLLLCVGLTFFDAGVVAAALDTASLGRPEQDQLSLILNAAAAWQAPPPTEATLRTWFPPGPGKDFARGSPHWDAQRLALGVRAWHSDETVAVLWLLVQLPFPCERARRSVSRFRTTVPSVRSTDGTDQTQPPPPVSVQHWLAAAAALPLNNKNTGVRIGVQYGLTPAQCVTALHPEWAMLWTLAHWSVRRSRRRQIECFRAACLDGPAGVRLVEELADSVLAATHGSQDHRDQQLLGCI